jgi:ketosteroid isomerase-like protein
MRPAMTHPSPPAEDRDEDGPNVAVVRELYAAFARKDAPRIRELFHSDIEWNQCAGFPGGGVHRGADNVLNHAFTQLRATWENWRADVSEYLDAGRDVIAIGEYSGTHRSTRKSMRAVFAHVYTLVDGRITRFRQYTDTAVLADAAR